MLDLKAIRRDPDAVRAALARRGDGSDARLDEALALDARRRELLPEVEGLRARQNEASQAIARAKKEGGDAADAIAEMQEVSRRVKALVGGARGGRGGSSRRALALLPNPPDPTRRRRGHDAARGRRAARSPNEPRDHLELAGGLIDMEAARARVGLALRLPEGRPGAARARARALGAGGAGRRTASSRSCRRCSCARRRCTAPASSPTPSSRSTASPTTRCTWWARARCRWRRCTPARSSTARRLPLRYAGFSPCFRREAGAAGRDTRGIFRVHQFDKVEMFSFVEPEAAVDEHERLLAIEEEILQALEIPYRVVNIAVDDLGASAAKKYDCEAWIPSQGRYREVTSTSNTTDFQARRLDIRYRPAGGGGPRHVATLNGTAVTWRHMIALLENGQREDGSVALPEVLHPWGAPEALRVGERA